MSLHIYIAHTGEHFLPDPVTFASYVFILAITRKGPNAYTLTITGYKLTICLQTGCIENMDCSKYRNSATTADFDDC